MTPQELRALIDGDAQATAFFESGNDVDCAARCRQLAPKQLVETRIRWHRIFGLFGSNLATAKAVYDQAQTVAASNGMIKEITDSLKADSVDPADLGNAVVRAMLVAPVLSGGVGLTQEQASPILAAAEREANITANDISEVRASF